MAHDYSKVCLDTVQLRGRRHQDKKFQMYPPFLCAIAYITLKAPGSGRA